LYRVVEKAIYVYRIVHASTDYPTLFKRVPKKSLQIISNNQFEKHASQNRSDTGNDRCGDAVIPFALIDLIGGTAPDKEVDNQSTRQNRGQDHQPRCQIGNEFFGSGCNLAVFDGGRDMSYM
jgi:hypothetical protein